MLGDSGLGAVNGFDGSFEVDPGVRQVQLDGDASVHGADAETRRSLDSSGLSRVSTAAGSGSRHRASASSSRETLAVAVTTR